MKPFRLFTVALFSVFTITQAHAADNGAPWESHSWAAPAWQGFYFGVNAGAVWGHDDSSQSTTAGASTGFNPGFDTTGGEEGFHAGYNYIAGNVLFGADADFDFSGTDGGYRLISNFNGMDEKFEWLSSLRARFGVPMGNFLPFVTGGVALSDIKDTFVVAGNSVEDQSQTRIGWTVGAGVEYALPENFTFRLDYRYFDFGSYTETPTVASPGFRYRQEPTLNTVTAGISYNFW